MDRLAFDDIQGIIVRGYKELSFARFLLVRMKDAALARAWLGTLPVTRASDPALDVATHIAFTWSGLRALRPDGLDPALFAPGSREGMSDAEHHNPALGDLRPPPPPNCHCARRAQTFHPPILLHPQ